jgi:hypothetical protein
MVNYVTFVILCDIYGATFLTGNWSKQWTWTIIEPDYVPCCVNLILQTRVTGELHRIGREIEINLRLSSTLQILVFYYVCRTSGHWIWRPPFRVEKKRTIFQDTYLTPGGITLTERYFEVFYLKRNLLFWMQVYSRRNVMSYIEHK